MTYAGMFNSLSVFRIDTLSLLASSISILPMSFQLADKLEDQSRSHTVPLNSNNQNHDLREDALGAGILYF